MDNVFEPKRRVRLVPLIISLCFLVLAILFAYCSAGVLYDFKTLPPDSDQTMSEALSIGISAAILTIFFWLLDIAAALVCLILSLVSIPSNVRWIRITAIITSVFAPVVGIFPYVFANLMP